MLTGNLVIASPHEEARGVLDEGAIGHRNAEVAPTNIGFSNHSGDIGERGLCVTETKRKVRIRGKGQKRSKNTEGRSPSGALSVGPQPSDGDGLDGHQLNCLEAARDGPIETARPERGIAIGPVAIRRLAKPAAETGMVSKLSQQRVQQKGKRTDIPTGRCLRRASQRCRVLSGARGRSPGPRGGPAPRRRAPGPQMSGLAAANDRAPGKGPRAAGLWSRKEAALNPPLIVAAKG